MKTLSDDVHLKILAHSKKGDLLLEQGFVKDAVFEYVRALRLLPKPIHEWEAATWLFSALGDAYWLLKDYERAYKSFQSALRCPDGIGNPFIHLRVGQLHYEFGNSEKAVDDLLRAYMGAGKAIFEGEDPKYFHLIEDLINNVKH